MKNQRIRSKINIWLLSSLIIFSLSISANAALENSNPDLLSTFRWRNIGPANMMGRVSALDALDDDYRIVLVGSASGGVFKSTNAGVT